MRTHVHSQDDALRSAASVLDVVTSARRLASWRDIGSASRGRFPCSIGSPGRNRTFVANPDSKSDPRGALASETVCRPCSARGQTSAIVRPISPESGRRSDISVTSWTTNRVQHIFGLVFQHHYGYSLQHDRHRQDPGEPATARGPATGPDARQISEARPTRLRLRHIPVSYTHLTLPTNRE